MIAPQLTAPDPPLQSLSKTWGFRPDFWAPCAAPEAAQGAGPVAA